MGREPDTELKWHLLNDHRNEAAGNLTDEEAVRQHFGEHHEPGGIRNHAEPLELHSWEVTRDPGGSLRLASDVPRCEAECVAHRAHLWNGTPVRGAGESSSGSARRDPPHPPAEWTDEPDLPHDVVIDRHGEVVVNWVGRVLRRRGFRVYEADLRTKYAEVKGYSTGPGEVDVLLGATPESLNVASPPGFTVLTLRPGRGDWNVVAGCARYTLQVVVWRDPRKLSGNDSLLGRVLDALRRW